MHESMPLILIKYLSKLKVPYKRLELEIMCKKVRRIGCLSVIVTYITTYMLLSFLKHILVVWLKPLYFKILFHRFLDVYNF